MARVGRGVLDSMVTNPLAAPTLWKNTTRVKRVIKLLRILENSIFCANYCYTVCFTPASSYKLTFSNQFTDRISLAYNYDLVM